MVTITFFKPQAASEIERIGKEICASWSANDKDNVIACFRQLKELFYRAGTPPEQKIQLHKIMGELISTISPVVLPAGDPRPEIKAIEELAKKATDYPTFMAYCTYLKTFPTADAIGALQSIYTSLNPQYAFPAGKEHAVIDVQLEEWAFNRYKVLQAQQTLPSEEKSAAGYQQPQP